MAGNHHSKEPRPSFKMTKTPTTIPVPELIPTQGKIGGYDEVAPFLHEVHKIVAEEYAKHESPDQLPWYTTWER